MKTSSTILLLSASAKVAKAASGRQCSADEINDTSLRDRVEHCSTLNTCYDFENNRFDNTRCGAAESCAEMNTIGLNDAFDGCILSQFCGVKGANYRGKPGQFQCQAGAKAVVAPADPGSNGHISNLKTCSSAELSDPRNTDLLRCSQVMDCYNHELGKYDDSKCPGHESCAMVQPWKEEEQKSDIYAVCVPTMYCGADKSRFTWGALKRTIMQQIVCPENYLAVQRLCEKSRTMKMSDSPGHPELLKCTIDEEDDVNDARRFQTCSAVKDCWNSEKAYKASNDPTKCTGPIQPNSKCCAIDSSQAKCMDGWAPHMSARKCFDSTRNKVSENYHFYCVNNNDSFVEGYDSSYCRPWESCAKIKVKGSDKVKQGCLTTKACNKSGIFMANGEQLAQFECPNPQAKFPYPNDYRSKSQCADNRAMYQNAQVPPPPSHHANKYHPNSCLLGIKANKKYCISSRDFQSFGKFCGDATKRDLCLDAKVQGAEDRQRDAEQALRQAQTDYDFADNQKANQSWVSNPENGTREEIEARFEDAKATLAWAKSSAAAQDQQYNEALGQCIGGEGKEQPAKESRDIFNCRKPERICTLNHDDSTVPTALNYMWCPNHEDICGPKILQYDEWRGNPVIVLEKMKKDQICTYIIQSPPGMTCGQVTNLSVQAKRNVKMNVYQYQDNITPACQSGTRRVLNSFDERRVLAYLPADATSEQIFRLVDINPVDRRIDFDEFARFMKQQDPKIELDQIIQVFVYGDTRRECYLSYGRFDSLLQELAVPQYTGAERAPQFPQQSDTDYIFDSCRVPRDYQVELKKAQSQTAIGGIKVLETLLGTGQLTDHMIFDLADVNPKDGFVSFGEFESFIYFQLPTARLSQIKELFAFMDVESSCELSKSDIAKGLETIKNGQSVVLLNGQYVRVARDTKYLYERCSVRDDNGQVKPLDEGKQRVVQSFMDELKEYSQNPEIFINHRVVNSETVVESKLGQTMYVVIQGTTEATDIDPGFVKFEISSEAIVAKPPIKEPVEKKPEKPKTPPKVTPPVEEEEVPAVVIPPEPEEEKREYTSTDISDFKEPCATLDLFCRENQWFLYSLGGILIVIAYGGVYRGCVVRRCVQKLERAKGKSEKRKPSQSAKRDQGSSDERAEAKANKNNRQDDSDKFDDIRQNDDQVLTPTKKKLMQGNNTNSAGRKSARQSERKRSGKRSARNDNDNYTSREDEVEMQNVPQQRQSRPDSPQNQFQVQPGNARSTRLRGTARGSNGRSDISSSPRSFSGTGTPNAAHRQGPYTRGSNRKGRASAASPEMEVISERRAQRGRYTVQQQGNGTPQNGLKKLKQSPNRSSRARPGGRENAYRSSDSDGIQYEQSVEDEDSPSADDGVGASSDPSDEGNDQFSNDNERNRSSTGKKRLPGGRGSKLRSEFMNQ